MRVSRKFPEKPMQFFSFFLLPGRLNDPQGIEAFPTFKPLIPGCLLICVGQDGPQELGVS